MRSSVFSMACALALLATTAGPARAEVTITPAARAEFKRGVELLQDKGGARYAEAYEAFRAAYDESPSPKILGNLGLCAMKLERDGEAIEAYERYLKEVGAVNRREKRQITIDLIKLRKRSTPVVVTIDAGDADVQITDRRLPAGGAPVINEYTAKDGQFETRLRRGRHRFEIEAEGHEPAEWEVEIGRKDVEHSIALTAIPEEPPPPPPEPVAEEPVEEESGFPSVGFIVAAAATGAFGIATGVVGGLSLANKSDFEDAVAAGDEAEAEDLRDRGQVLNGVTDGLLVTTAVAAGVTIVFLVLDLTSGGDDEPEVSWVPAPWIGPQRGGLAFTGAF